MAYKALIFGTDDIYKELKPFYKREIQRGNLEIVAYVDDVTKLGGGMIYPILKSR